MRLRDDLAVIALLTVLAVLLLWLWLGWASSRDETGMARVETVTTTTSTTAPEVELEPRGWPADWLSEREIGLIAWSLHLDHLAEAEPEPVPEVDASSMAIEQTPSGEIVVTNPPEAPIAHHGDEPEGGWTVWDRLAACESGDKHIVGSANWHINSGNGYSGGLQWLPDTWRRAGGHQYAPHAWQATREQEIAVAEAWLARTSWGQWPGCARFLGLR